MTYAKTPNRLAAKLRPAAEKKVKQGHPWVFSDSIAKISPGGTTGDLVILFGQAENKPFAIGLYDAASPVRIKIIHRGPAMIDEAFFKKKIEDAFALRQALRKRTNAYRLIFGENDGFPGLIVDVYDLTGVLKLYSGAWLPYLETMSALITEVAGTDRLILRLSRNVQRQYPDLQEGRLLAGTPADPVVQFSEFGVRFQADLISGHKTGFFLDHRANRRRIGQVAKDKTVLDVFSYAGGFSVHALAGGASEVTSVDISAQALDLAVQNAALNESSGIHRTMAGDAFDILAQLVKKRRRFDIVVIDPPSLAKSGKEVPLAKKKYAQLANLGASLTKPGGLLLLASCSSRVSEEEFKQVHRDAFHQSGAGYILEDFTTHDADHPVLFPEGAYLKSAYYRMS